MLYYEEFTKISLKRRGKIHNKYESYFSTAVMPEGEKFQPPQSAGINMQSPQSESTPRRLTLITTHSGDPSLISFWV